MHFLHNLDRVKHTPVDLVFDGDSITDGWQGGGKEVWAKNYDKLKATDFGIGGDRTENLLWRLDHGQLDGLHPKMVALMIGTNNIGLTAEQIAEGVTADVREYQKLCPDAVILLQAIFPRSEKATDPVRAKIKQGQRDHLQARRRQEGGLHRLRRQIPGPGRHAPEEHHARLSAPQREGLRNLGRGHPARDRKGVRAAIGDAAVNRGPLFQQNRSRRNAASAGRSSRSARQAT